MRVTRAAGQKPGERADVDHFRAFAGLVIDLLVRSRRQEAGERVNYRQDAATGHASRHRPNVLLGYTALDEAMRIFLRERDEAAVLDQVGVERHEMRVTIRLRDDCAFVGGYQVVGLTGFTPRIASTRLEWQRSEPETGEQLFRARSQFGNRRRVSVFTRRTRVEQVQLVD